MPAEGAISFSIILPIYNEEGNLSALLEEIHGSMSGLGRPFEVIAVDDGSRDGSLAVLREFGRTHPGLRIVRHRGNHGQSAAFATGLARARGEVIVTLDSDRQNDPADLPRMIAALEDGVAAVVGVRKRREDSLVRRISSRIANGYRDLLTGVPVRDAGCFLRVMRRDAVRELPVFNGLHRFVVTLLRYQGYRVVEMDVGHRARTAGVSKYGVANRLWRGLRDCLAMRWYRARVIRGDRVLAEESASE